MLRIDHAQIQTFGIRGRMNLCGVVHVHHQRIKPRWINQLHAVRGQLLRHRRSERMHPLGDSFQAIRAVIHRIHARHNCQQSLRGTNI